MGAFSRIRYVIAANLNALLEKAEDPEKLLRALIREMEDAGEDARLATADLLAEQQHLARVAERIENEISEWRERAEKAVATNRDDLARAALKAKSELADQLDSARDDHGLLTDRIAHLETDMTTLKTKLAEAKSTHREMTRKDKGGPAPSRKETQLSANERKLRHAMHRFDRLQHQVERLEARVRSYEVGGTAPSAWEYETGDADPAIEAELDELRKRVLGKTPAKETSNPEKPVEKVTAEEA